MVEQQWRSTPALRRFLIDPQTLASQSLPAIGVNAPSGAVVTWDGSMFIAVWSDYGQASTSAVMTLPFSDGTDVQPGAVLTENGTATDAIAAFNGRNVVAAWLERANGHSDVAGVRLDPTATQTAGAFHYLHGRHLPPRMAAFPFPMAIAADATGCWISWSDADVHLAHVGASGVDVAPVVIATGAVRPAFAPGSIAYTRTDPDQTVVVVRDLPAHPRRRTAGR
jgi:hypothetical protein